MIAPHSIEQIKNRIDIIDVIGDYVKLKKRGANYLGNCPFHNEKSPSFTVSPAKELYKCFGCGKSGNAITFLMEHDKMGYVEALKWLANRYNIEIEETETSAEQKQVIQTADSLYIINKFANEFLQQQLWETETGQAIGLSYLKERGFNEEIAKRFQIGYNPENNNPLSKALIEHQFNKELLPKTGLVALRNETDFVDNYRGRIIFPIHNITGKVIGFGARVLGNAGKAPKYINTPENEIYLKSKVLYGSYFARQAIGKENECLLVEGYTDVVSLHQAGIENVVASGGTSLTIDQIRLVKKYTPNLTIIYDGDAAGIKAALRGLDMALEESLNVKLVLIPDKEDPDSYVNKVGAAAFKQFIADNKKDFIVFQLEVMMKEVGNDIAGKNNVVNHIAETLSKINRVEDFLKQQEYIKICAGLLKIDENGLVNLVNKFKRDKFSKQHAEEERNKTSYTAEQVGDEPPPPEQYQELDSLASGDDAYEKNMIRVLLETGLKPWNDDMSIAEFIFQELETFPFDNPALTSFYNSYRIQYQQGLQPDTKTYLYHPDEAIRTLVNSITFHKNELSENWDKVLEGMNIVNRDVSKQDVWISLNYFKLRKIKKMLTQNQDDMENAAYEEQKKLIMIHLDLKQIEKELTKQIGVVIIR